MVQLRVGSEEHKTLFCREFVDTFHPYEVRDIRWPRLADDDLQRLRALPHRRQHICDVIVYGRAVRIDAQRFLVLHQRFVRPPFFLQRHPEVHARHRILARHGHRVRKQRFAVFPQR